MWAKKRRPIIEERLIKLVDYSNNISVNRLEWGNRKIGIVAAGPVYHYAREVFPDASFLKIGMSFPLPKGLIRQLAEGVETLLVIEELDPFMEEQIKAMGIKCIGKEIFLPYDELLPSTIERNCAKAGLLPFDKVAEQRDIVPKGLPSRSPVLCPGCPHRSTFYNLSIKAKFKNLVITGDIGCYNLGALAPFYATDTMGSMGAGFGVAHGFDIAGLHDTDQKVIGIVGDSTFFHNGVTPLLNIVHNGGRSTLVILDNETTAMTGNQDHAGLELSLNGKGVRVDIEGLVRGCGVKFVRKANAFNVKDVEKAFADALEFEGPSVVIVEGPCVFTGDFRKDTYAVEPETCTACGVCFRLGCPAIARSNDVYSKTGKHKAMIDPVLCVGCDVCAQVCPPSAIYSTAPDNNKQGNS